MIGGIKGASQLTKAVETVSKETSIVSKVVNKLIGGGDDVEGIANTVGKVPNPFGKAGGPLHQGKIQEVINDLQQQGYKLITKEAPIQTTGGFKNLRYGDALLESFIGEKIIIQIGKQTKGGLPISRERKAIQDLEKSGYKVQFYPYNK
jgi:hypothetical protein